MTAATTMMAPCDRFSTPETPKIRVKAGGAQGVEAADREAVDQDLEG